MTETQQDQAMETSTAPRAVVVPDKPALEGLEEKWGERWEDRPDLRLRPHPAARERLLDRHAAADGERLAARRATSSPTPTPTSSRGSSGCAARRSSTPWAGTTTGCRPSGACRTTTASAATRRCPTRRTSPRRRSRTRSVRSRSAGPTSSSCASSSSRRTRRSSSSSGARSASRSTGATPTRPSASHAREISQRAFLRNFARGEAYLAEAPTVWDVTYRTAVAQAEIEAREYPGAYHRVAFHRPDGSPVYVETTRPELIPSAVALIAHPDDERYQALFGTTVTSPVFGVEIPVVAHHARRAGQGRRASPCAAPSVT